MAASFGKSRPPFGSSSPFDTADELERLMQVSPVAEQLFPLATEPLPAFPELGEPGQTQTGAQVFEIELGPGTIPGGVPGHPSHLRLWLPTGRHPDGSLGCILIAPAGTNQLTGHAIEDPSYDVEMAPYVEAGYAVFHNAIDGDFNVKEPGEADLSRLRQQHELFKRAMAGLVNARSALELVLARAPQVDPARIFAVGHSSAGTLVLLFAAS